jgi:exosortase/archaeosortase family protein
MKKFILLYWTTTALFFAIFYWDISPISNIINSMQTDFTTLLTSLTLEDGMIDGYSILISQHYHLIIEKACNGLIPYLFFIASIIAFPSTIIHKIIWAVIGYVVLIVVNVFRIWMITQLVLDEVGNFSLAHDVIGNALLIFTSLLLFILFVKSRARYNTKK